ncbi:hypothetical protein DFQ28_008396 [Apophysomyces sp. BC1034]|nr:hypothetical protein DFQ30_007929 [Apophysomyces sp. BC1015]KAG0181880.1 hypothetical protein DFQ29_006674 [Apophysomyces sp. BC1021]KAG0192647.1 hypothetical protein DFQ28_008396 [Apophysomyces sp. BC1034]
MQDIRTRGLRRDDAVIRLLLLHASAMPREYKIIKSLASLIQKLPEKGFDSKIMEQELIALYLDPALSPLLDDPAKDVFFR